MLILKLGQVIDILVDNDVQVVSLVVGGHVGRGECFRHFVGRVYLEFYIEISNLVIQSKNTSKQLGNRSEGNGESEHEYMGSQWSRRQVTAEFHMSSTSPHQHHTSQVHSRLRRHEQRVQGRRDEMHSTKLEKVPDLASLVTFARRRLVLWKVI